jgi:hypothetical protein
MCRNRTLYRPSLLHSTSLSIPTLIVILLLYAT